MGFKGLKPSSQPRSLRSVAESKGTTPAGFSEVETQAQSPQKVEVGELGSPTRVDAVNAPNPFANMKGGH